MDYKKWETIALLADYFTVLMTVHKLDRARVALVKVLNSCVMWPALIDGV